MLKYALNKDINYVDSSVIYNLTPKSYTYNSDVGAGTQIGYIAEEVMQIHPNLTTYNGYEEPLIPVAINYDVITVFLVEELKKLKTSFIDLTAKYNALEQRLAQNNI
jgi:hypothetical protein